MTENPFEYLMPVEPAAFAGRVDLANALLADLISAKGKSYALVGGRRCGKSSFLRYLAHGLTLDQAAPSGHWVGLPLLFDFKQASFASEDAFLAHLLNEIRARCDEAEWLPPDDAWPVQVKLDAPQFQELAQRPTLALSDFERGLQYILRCLDAVLPDTRLILLIDEMDETVNLDWSIELQNRLRALIYSGRVRNRVRLVLAGSHRFLDQVNAQGSPLLNVLEHLFLTAFDETGLRAITERAVGLSDQARELIATQSGRHPYLAQYLLHHLWATTAGDVEGVANEQVLQMARQFCHERRLDLEGWVNGVEVAGVQVYDLLTTFDGPVDEEEIRRRVDDQGLNLVQGLHALCYHGVVQHAQWKRYQVGSELFRTWFLAERERLLQRVSQLKAEGASGPIFHVHGDYVGGDKVGQDKIGQDKIGQDKVGGDQIDVNIAESGGGAVGRGSNASTGKSGSIP